MRMRWFMGPSLSPMTLLRYRIAEQYFADLLAERARLPSPRFFGDEYQTHASHFLPHPVFLAIREAKAPTITHPNEKFPLRL